MHETDSIPLGVAVIGLGFMGQTHVAAYHRAARDGLPVALVAVSDQNPERLTGLSTTAGNINTTDSVLLFDPSSVATYTNPRDLLADERVGLVSIATHTDTHVDLAIAALRAGKHVIVEKPVAISVEAIERLIGVARESKTLCLPAMCKRFWPGWTLMLDAVRDGRYGSVISARFERLGSPPSWAHDFYLDPSRSGGVLFDLHVHDADFILGLLGPPESLRSFGTPSHITTAYHYPGIPGHIIAEGGWVNAPSFPFRIRFMIEFERAVADFDFAREPTLLMHSADGSHAPPLPRLTAYEAEVQHAIELALGRATTPRVSLDDALLVTRLLHAELTSLTTGKVAEF
ncbi:MAG: Gfo/Idh/MocA family oxidoreductase [Phycisphaeraceae bacterium]|nr:Gfo/Idh/MocA family oxidoreductase [Phycisphaeraceae bacterium]MCW5764019.1 Gfo/Idh/MocA family oxidoreductase [Phycisphaeraceae bacterium]